MRDKFLQVFYSVGIYLLLVKCILQLKLFDRELIKIDFERQDIKFKKYFPCDLYLSK